MAFRTEATAIAQRIAAVAASRSPELNPAEQAWQQLRDRSLANRCYDSYDDIINACCEAWNKFTQIPNAIRSLCTRN